MWSWPRLLRIAALVVVLLLAVEVALGERARRMDADAHAARLRNTEARGMVDACLRMLRALPPEGSDAVVVVGASVSYGANLPPDEAVPAHLAEALHETSPERRVLNCSQAGANNDSSLAVAAAAGSRPFGLLLVEAMVPLFADRERPPSPPWSEEEVSLLEMANAAQREQLRRTGHWPSLPARVEARLVDAAREHWRLFRLRGPLWIDDHMIPDALVWTLRREAAEAGFLPRRFHGQTTNVGRLPWRKAYVDGQRPQGAQRFVVPVAAISEREYTAILQVQQLAALAGVPVVFYEVPLNLPFQREFGLSDEAELARLAELRAMLRERMARDGLAWLDAPPLDDDAFLDRAHLTPGGSRALGRYLAAAIQAR
jgi:hypothetical protein